MLGAVQVSFSGGQQDGQPLGPGEAMVRQLQAASHSLDHRLSSAPLQLFGRGKQAGGPGILAGGLQAGTDVVAEADADVSSSSSESDTDAEDDSDQDEPDDSSTGVRGCGTF